MNCRQLTYRLLILPLILLATNAQAQSEVSAKVDARKITIGDQIKLFIEAKPDKEEQLIWAVLPDTFNSLEIVEKGKIDTMNNNGIISYKQKLLITGWDSGRFQIPPFEFTANPKQGQPYTIRTDSFDILVQTIPVDTTKPFKPIASIIEVKMTWRDYIWYIIGGILAIGLIVFLVLYFRKNKGNKAPLLKPKKPVEKPFDRAVRMLKELDEKQLWQNDHIKQYYVELTDILRTYIEARFNTSVMELTSDELLEVVSRNSEMAKFREPLATILRTADMAKFAKAQPLPQEHTDAFDKTKDFVLNTKPVEVNTKKQA